MGARKTPNKRQPIEDRFWRHVARGAPDECWPWTGGLARKGYGQFTLGRTEYGKEKIGAHRMAFILAKGEIPDGLQVCHTCDNPVCCNPAHLWLGSNGDNQADMWRKGRSSWQREGYCPPRAGKLTPEDVREIRRLHATGQYTYRDLAPRYGVSPEMVGYIVRGQSWRGV